MTTTKELRREVSEAFDVAKGVGGMLAQVTYAIWTLARRPPSEPPRPGLTQRMMADPAAYAAAYAKLVYRYAIKSQRLGELRTELRNKTGALAEAEQLVADLRVQRDQYRKVIAAHRKYLQDKLQLSLEDQGALDGLRTSLDDHGEYNGEGDLTRSVGEAIANGAA